MKKARCCGGCGCRRNKMNTNLVTKVDSAIKPEDVAKDYQELFTKLTEPKQPEGRPDEAP